MEFKMKTLFTILLTTFTLSAQAKTGDTFIDPEFGKITVKGPSFENDFGDYATQIVNGKEVIVQTTEYKFKSKIEALRNKFQDIGSRLHSNMSEQDIIKEVKELTKQYQELNSLRKVFYIDGYNQKMLFFYKITLQSQHSKTLEYWDYLIKVKDKPEYKQFLEKVRFSLKVYENIKLYEFVEDQT